MKIETLAMVVLLTLLSLIIGKMILIDFIKAYSDCVELYGICLVLGL